VSGRNRINSSPQLRNSRFELRDRLYEVRDPSGIGRRLRSEFIVDCLKWSMYDQQQRGSGQRCACSLYRVKQASLHVLEVNAPVSGVTKGQSAICAAGCFFGCD